MRARNYETEKSAHLANVPLRKPWPLRLYVTSHSVLVNCNVSDVVDSCLHSFACAVTWLLHLLCILF